MNNLLIILTSLLSFGGQLCQKQAAEGSGSRHLVTWLGLSLVLMGSALLVWLLVLQHLPVSVAYPMLSLNFIFITLAARWIWHEQISVRHWLGVAIIIGGIILLAGAA